MRSEDFPDEIEFDKAYVKLFGLWGFLRLTWHLLEPATPFKDNWSIGELCAHLEAVSSDDPRTVGLKKLVVNVPPGTCKSITTCINWPAYVWTINPSKKWIFASYDLNLVGGFARRTRELICTDWFQARWPLRVLDRADTAYRIEGGGWRFTTSTPDGKVTGQHADIQVVDDPIKAAEAQDAAGITRTMLDKVINWWDGTMPSRVADPKNAAYAIIMQRLHDDDLAGHVLATDTGVTHLSLPMRFEPERACRTPIGGDQRTEPGELLWPDRFGEAEIVGLETRMNVYADAQLQQRPSREGGQIIRTTWLRHWTELPPSSEILEWVLSWDMTFKDTAGSDFVCGQVWCRTAGNYYLVDRIYERMNFPTTLNAFVSQCRTYPQALCKLVEDKANGPAVLATLEGKVPGLVAVPVSGSKVGRLNAVSPLYRAGNVYYPHPDLPGKAWVREHMRDVTGFPFARHDDTVDAETQVLSYFQEARNPLLEALAKLGAKGVQAMLR